MSSAAPGAVHSTIGRLPSGLHTRDATWMERRVYRPHGRDRCARTWVIIAEGYIHGEGSGEGHAFEIRETACIVNAGADDAKVRITPALGLLSTIADAGGGGG